MKILKEDQHLVDLAKAGHVGKLTPGDINKYQVKYGDIKKGEKGSADRINYDQIEKSLSKKVSDKNKDINDKNSKIREVEKSNETMSKLGEIQKAFDSTKFRTDRDFKISAANALKDFYENKLNLKNVRAALSKYSPDFIKSWADSFNWQSVGSPDEPFINALNNPSSSKILTGDESNWVKLYNLLYDKDGDEVNNYVKQNDALIYNPKLYDGIPPRDINNVVSVDLKLGSNDARLRRLFNNSLNNNNYSSIIKMGMDKGLSPKVNNIPKTLDELRDSARNLSTEDKSKLSRTLKDFANRLDNATGN